jgi:hypothetical protein
MRDIGYIVPNTFLTCYFIWLVVTNQYPSAESSNSFVVQFWSFVAVGWFLLEIATMLTNAKRRALHDYIARTVVVRVSDNDST